MRSPSHGIVLGAGLAGLLAACAIADHLDRVTVVERDLLPAKAAHRRGVPQGRHAHVLAAGGARAIDALLPGSAQRWLDAGARRFDVPGDLVTLTPVGWMRRWPGIQFLISCSRELLDLVVREQVLTRPAIRLCQDTEVVDLLGDLSRVTGVMVRRRETGDTSPLDADLVIDATGRGSRMPQWLHRLGSDPVREMLVDTGVGYATRIFAAPSPVGGQGRWPIVNIQASFREPGPVRGGLLLPIEDDRWLVTIAGGRGAVPSTQDRDFERFARSLRHPLLADLIATAVPLTPVYGSRSTANRRRYVERLSRWPDGLLTVGDAVATFNPLYGHGMSVAAQQAVAIRGGLTVHGLEPGATRRIQRDVCGTVNGAWTMATSQDVFYPGVIGGRPSVFSRLMQRYLERQMRTAYTRPAVARAFVDAFSLSGPMTALVAPGVMLATLRGPRGRISSEPPLTDDERRLLAEIRVNGGASAPP